MYCHSSSMDASRRFGNGMMGGLGRLWSNWNTGMNELRRRKLFASAAAPSIE